MDQKTLSTAVLGIGVVTLAASLFADSFGIGATPGFGFDQATGLVTGTVLIAVGLFFTIKAT